MRYKTILIFGVLLMTSMFTGTQADDPCFTCSTFDNQVDCEYNGCYWWTLLHTGISVCHSRPEPDQYLFTDVYVEVTGRATTVYSFPHYDWIPYVGGLQYCAFSVFGNRMLERYKVTVRDGNDVLFDRVIKDGFVQIWTPDGYFYWEGHEYKVPRLPPKIDIDCYVEDLYGGELDGVVYIQVWEYGLTPTS